MEKNNYVHQDLNFFKGRKNKSMKFKSRGGTVLGSKVGTEKADMTIL